MATLQPGAERNGRKPPKWLFKYLFNPLMTLLLRSPLHDRISDSLMLITFTGRKSGKQFTTPVGYHREGKEVLVFTVSPWWKNLEGGAKVKMLLKGETVRGQADVEHDTNALLARVAPFVQEHGPRQSRRVALTLSPNRDYTTEDLRKEIEAQGLVMIRIHPVSDSNQATLP